jgi:hypothetical protein
VDNLELCGRLHPYVPRRGRLGEKRGWIRRDRQARRARPWFPLRFNQVDGRALRGRVVGPVRAVAELRAPGPGCVYDVFWLLSFGF